MDTVRVSREGSVAIPVGLVVRYAPLPLSIKDGHTACAPSWGLVLGLGVSEGSKLDPEATRFHHVIVGARVQLLSVRRR